MRYGFPVCTANNVFAVLRDLGIQPWPHAESAVSMETYLSGELTEAERNEALRFGPKAEVVSLTQPNGRPFRGFRSIGKDWATTFVLLPDGLVPIIGEYKHGSDDLTLVPPSGIPNRDEREQADGMAICAKREWEEETGLRLERVTPLSRRPHVIAGRQSTLHFYPFIGEIAHPIEKGESKLDANEYLKLVLLSLEDWLRLIEHGRGIEACGASITLLALRRLGLVSTAL